MAYISKNRAPAIGAFLFFSTFALYLLTVAPSVTFWDSGELIAASCRLGIAHQPGYPLFCILGRLFAFMPLGSMAYRLNLLSAFFSAASVFVVYLVLLEIIRGAGPSSTGPGAVNYALPALLALSLAAIRAFWSQAVVTEVYALNSFFLAVLVLAYVKTLSGALSSTRYFALSGLISGLGVIDHMSFVLFMPGLFLTWLVLPVEDAGLKRLRGMLLGVVFMLAGLSVYLYLPVRSAVGAEFNIGHPDTLREFWRVIKWGEYFRHLSSALASMAALFGKIKLLDIRVFIAGLAAAYFVWRLFKMDWRLFLPLLAFLAMYALGISSQVLGSARDEMFDLSAKFYIPVFMLAVIFIGALSRDTLITAEGRLIELAIATTYGVAALALAYYNYAPNDYSRNFIGYDYAMNSLKSAGEDGVLFTWGDNGAFPLWYVQQVERYRDDAAVIHAPLMTYDWYLGDVDRALGSKTRFMEPYFLGENVYRIFNAVTPARPVAYDYSSTHFLKLDLRTLKVRGLVYYEGPVPPGNPWQYYVFRGVDDPTVFKGPMERNIIAIYDHMRKVSGPAPLQP